MLSQLPQCKVHAAQRYLSLFALTDTHPWSMLCINRQEFTKKQTALLNKSHGHGYADNYELAKAVKVVVGLNYSSNS